MSWTESLVRSYASASSLSTGLGHALPGGKLVKLTVWTLLREDPYVAYVTKADIEAEGIGGCLEMSIGEHYVAAVRIMSASDPSDDAYFERRGTRPSGMLHKWNAKAKPDPKKFWRAKLAREERDAQAKHEELLRNPRLRRNK